MPAQTVPVSDLLKQAIRQALSAKDGKQATRLSAVQCALRHGHIGEGFARSVAEYALRKGGN